MTNNNFCVLYNNNIIITIKDQLLAIYYMYVTECRGIIIILKLRTVTHIAAHKQFLFLIW